MPQRFPKDSAGRIMTTGVPVVSESEILEDVLSRLRKAEGDFETLNYAYVVDKAEKLVGVLSLKQILQGDPESSAGDVMVRDPLSVRPSTDQERAALLAVRHSLKSVPVVDHFGTFLGAVSSDTIQRVLSEEHSEDLLYAGGVEPMSDAKKLLGASALTLFKIRFPWLLVGLAGGVLAALIVGGFEEVLDEFVMLAFFVPLVVYMSDAVATQTQMIFIRALVVGDLSIRRYMIRDGIVGLLLAVILGLALGLVGLLWFQDTTIAIILSLSLFCAVLVSVLVALLIPLFLVALKKDPAIGSGPFATIIIDITTIVIYFSIASFFIGVL